MGIVATDPTNNTSRILPRRGTVTDALARESKSFMGEVVNGGIRQDGNSGCDTAEVPPCEVALPIQEVADADMLQHPILSGGLARDMRHVECLMGDSVNGEALPDDDICSAEVVKTPAHGSVMAEVSSFRTAHTEDCFVKAKSMGKT